MNHRSLTGQKYKIFVSGKVTQSAVKSNAGLYSKYKQEKAKRLYTQLNGKKETLSPPVDQWINIQVTYSTIHKECYRI